MSQAVVPPPSAPKRSGFRRRALPWLLSTSENRSIQIGIIGTILIHLILLFLAPHFFKLAPIHSTLRPHAKPNQFNIEIQPNLFPRPKPAVKPPMKFVEANPNAPENTPDKTNNFSDRNQQVAQQKPTPNGRNDMPALEGRKDVQSTQIVDGRLTKPQESAPPASTPSPPAPPSAAAPRAEQNPLSGFEKKQSDNLDAFGSNIAKPTDSEKPIPDKIDGVKNTPLIENSTAVAPQIDRHHPQPRRTLAPQSRPAIFTDNKFGTSNIGPTAVDARWSNYGVYLQRMFETVQIQWDSILDESRIYPNSGTQVSVKFVMNSKGDISRIVNVDSSNGMSDAARRACVSAITARAPYGDWTADMIAVLGSEQEMTFTFYYQ